MKYHYLYKITNNITNQFYYGVHSTDDLNDYYFGSGSKLRENILEYGRENFEKKNLEFFPNRKLLMDAEKRIVNVELLSNPKCLNVIMGGGAIKGSVGKKCVINESGEKIMINKSIQDYDFFMKGYVCINKNNRLKYIPSFLLQDYLDMGWSKGTIYDSPGKGKLWIYKDDIRKQIYPYELQDYINDGWKKGMGRKGMIWVYKDDIPKQIYPYELQDYINDGWKKGFGKNTVNNKIAIIKENIIKYIDPNEFQDYINNGWGKKRWKEYIWITKGKNNKRIHISLLQDYINSGWEKGRYNENNNIRKRIYMYDGDKLIQIFNKVKDAEKQLHINIKTYINKNRLYKDRFELRYDMKPL